jgi:hypothetical protein
MRRHVGVPTVAISLLLAGALGTWAAEPSVERSPGENPTAGATQKTPPKTLNGIVTSVDKDAGRVVIETHGQGVFTLASEKLDVGDMNAGDRVVVQMQLQKPEAATAPPGERPTGGVASGARARGTSAEAPPASSQQFRNAIPVTGTIERIDKSKGYVSIRGEHDQRIENVNLPKDEVASFSQGDRVTALVAVARGTQAGGGPSTSGAPGGGPH